MLTSELVRETIIKVNPLVIGKINHFAAEVLKTRGKGRVGSGMGTLLESLWGFYTNEVLLEADNDCEIGWLSDHEYNDFACVKKGEVWKPSVKEGEFLRIEAKSMNIGVDESKGHFDVLTNELDNDDLLLILVWSWESLDDYYVFPRIHGAFIDRALDIAKFRDRLHIARGGLFVEATSCPDNCIPENCSHEGEPLNADGKRERITGPNSRRPSQNVSYANNFGGLVRMLKTNSLEARDIFRNDRLNNPIVHKYISFIYHHFDKEEINQYTAEEWRNIAKQLDIDTIKNYKNKPKKEIVKEIRERYETKKEYFDLFLDI